MDLANLVLALTTQRESYALHAKRATLELHENMELRGHERLGRERKRQLNCCVAKT